MRRGLLGLPIALSIALVGAGCGDGCRRSKGEASGAAARDAGEPLDRTARTPPFRAIDTGRKHIVYQQPPELPLFKRLMLDHPGKGPRRLYRYRPPVAARALWVTARVETRELKDKTWTPYIELPELRYGVALDPAAGAAANRSAATGERSPPGARDEYTVYLRGLPSHIGEPPRQSDPRLTEHAVRGAGLVLDRYRRFLEKRRATVQITTRGRIGALTLSPDMTDMAAGARDQIHQLLLEAVVPLPEQAIGPGARWTAVFVMRRDNSVVTQTAEYQLVQARRDRLELAVRLTQIGQHQTLAEPDLPPSITAELIALFWQARGELVIELSSLTPMSGSLEVELRAHNRITAPAQSMDRFVESRGAVTLETNVRDRAGAGEKHPPARPSGQ